MNGVSELPDFTVSPFILTSGAHPRIGALDVCPFVPVTNVTMEECVKCSREFSQQLAEELHVPVYLYECAQEKEYRKSLGQIREGEYEGLKEKVGGQTCVLPTSAFIAGGVLTRNYLVKWLLK